MNLAKIALWLALCAATACEASALRFCDRQPELSAAQQDKLIRFGAIVKAELEASGQNIALVARSGLDLSRFGVRYSHAGLSLKASQNTPWSVRQLYYACDEQKPRIFDQGMSGFVMGTDDASIGYVSIVLLPAAEADALERAALDNRQALQLLGASYSANAYPFSLRYQNCNQWVIELLATAWGQLGEAENPRAQAQGWLKDMHYQPSTLDIGWRPLMWLGAFIPWVHGDDHPDDDIAQSLYRVSMPASIDNFVRATVPGATRIELCHTDRRVVIRHGWEAIGEGCQASQQDTVLTLE
ncbi:MAG TPA: DUF2145 domain-containing protein [Albitalea sp.]|nr:DUF2145 domain-containing protein [Albitalea sp.]